MAEVPTPDNGDTLVANPDCGICGDPLVEARIASSKWCPHCDNLCPHGNGCSSCHGGMLDDGIDSMADPLAVHDTFIKRKGYQPFREKIAEEKK